MRYLAIDYGNKRTGLAICDPGEIIVSPLAVVSTGQEELLKKIKEIIEAENVEAVVVGLPLNMDDSQGPQAKKTLKFAQLLRENIDIPVHLHDERLSTFSAEEKLAAADFTKKGKAKRLDAVAAAEILQAFIDTKNM